MIPHKCSPACEPKIGDLLLRGITEENIEFDEDTGEIVSISYKAFQILGEGMSVQNERLIGKSNEELAAYLTSMRNGKWPHWVGFMHNELTENLSLEIAHTPSQYIWAHCDLYYERPSNKFPQWLQSELASTAQFFIKNGAKAA